MDSFNCSHPARLCEIRCWCNQLHEGFPRLLVHAFYQQKLNLVFLQRSFAIYPILSFEMLCADLHPPSTYQKIILRQYERLRRDVEEYHAKVFLG